MTIICKEVRLETTSLKYLSVETASPKRDAKVLVFLHGFPENSWSWERYLYHYSDHYQVFAPDLPGYNGSEGFKGYEGYSLSNLIETMVHFIRLVSPNKKVVLVAHDWGGAIAWPLVAFHENLIEKFIVMNAAHPSTFTREMINNPKQQALSNYISDLVSDNGYELVSENNFNRLVRLFGGYFDKLSNTQQRAYLEQWEDRQSMLNAFAYYKCMPVLVTEKTPIDPTQALKIPSIILKCPTLVLWGMKDTAFVTQVLDGLSDYIETLNIKKFDDADHWLHHQKFEDLLEEIDQFLR